MGGKPDILSRRLDYVLQEGDTHREQQETTLIDPSKLSGFDGIIQHLTQSQAEHEIEDPMLEFSLAQVLRSLPKQQEKMSANQIWKLVNEVDEIYKMCEK